MQAYHEICPNDQNKGVYSLQFKEYPESFIGATEYYCANPKCNCTDFLMVFMAYAPQKKFHRELFSLRIDLQSWKIIERKVKVKNIPYESMIAKFMEKALDGLKQTILEHKKNVAITIKQKPS